MDMKKLWQRGVITVEYMLVLGLVTCLGTYVLLGDLGPAVENRTTGTVSRLNTVNEATEKHYARVDSMLGHDLPADMSGTLGYTISLADNDGLDGYMAVAGADENSRIMEGLSVSDMNIRRWLDSIGYGYGETGRVVTVALDGKPIYGKGRYLAGSHLVEQYVYNEVTRNINGEQVKVMELIGKRTISYTLDRDSVMLGSVSYDA